MFKVWLEHIQFANVVPLRMPGKQLSRRHTEIQYNLNGSNPDGSFTVGDSNSFFQSLQNPSNSLRKQIFRDFFSDCIMEMCVVCTR